MDRPQGTSPEEYYTIIITLFMVTYIGINTNCILNVFQDAKEEDEDPEETVKENASQVIGEMEQINKIISEEIIKALPEVNEEISWRLIQYAADKTGLADFASEKAGAAIVRVENTSAYVKPTRIGFIPMSNTQGPESILQSSRMPGDCWAFKGSTASVVIKLATDIYITSITLEHIPKAVSPSGNISSAPKDFSVWGMVSPHDKNNLLLGKYIYNINEKPWQQFLTEKRTTKPLRYIKLKVHSNHGNPDYTCIYRLRVHGKPL